MIPPTFSPIPTLDLRQQAHLEWRLVRDHIAVVAIKLATKRNTHAEAASLLAELRGLAKADANARAKLAEFCAEMEP